MTERGFSDIPKEGSVVRSMCWCETQYVWVPIEEVNAGLTGPCRDPECRQQNRDAGNSVKGTRT